MKTFKTKQEAIIELEKIEKETGSTLWFIAHDSEKRYFAEATLFSERDREIKDIKYQVQALDVVCVAEGSSEEEFKKDLQKWGKKISERKKRISPISYGL